MKHIMVAAYITLALSSHSLGAESGRIVSVSPSSFYAGQSKIVTVRVQNTGDADDMIVECYSKRIGTLPTGWTVTPQDLNPYMANAAYYDATFTVTPPSSASSGTIVWKFFDDDIGVHPSGSDELASYSQSVSATTHPPVASRQSPSSSSVSMLVNVSQTFTVAATDAGGDLQKVEWYVDGSYRDYDDIGFSGSSDTSSYGFSWSAAGSHTVTAKVYDDRGDTASVSWSVSVDWQRGSIQATLNNWNGTPASGANTKFIRYNGGTPIPLVGSNPDTFTGVPVGNHWVEGYQKNTTWNEYEYWGAVETAVTLNNTAPAVINRHTPYCEDFWFEWNGTRVEAANKVPQGSTVVAKATIRNKDTSVSSRTIRLNASWRYGASGSGTAIPAVTTTIGPNMSKTVTLGSVSLSATEDDVYAYIMTYAVFSDPNNPALTDGWGWAKKFEASTGSRPTVANVIISALDGGAVSPIIPGKRYIVTAEVNDDDGQSDLTAAWVYLKNPNHNRKVGVGYSFAGRKLVDDLDAGVCRDDGGQSVPLQDEYVCLTHVEKETINSGKGWRLRFIFWLTAKWPNSSIGTDYQGSVTDKANHTTTGDWTHKAVDFNALSLPAGKWTIFVHGKTCQNDDWTLFLEDGENPFGEPPDQWDQHTEWFNNVSTPASTLGGGNGGWMGRFAQKLAAVSAAPVRICRLGDRQTGALQEWHPETRRFESTDALWQGHTILLFDWGQPSDYLADGLTRGKAQEDNWFAYAAGDALFAYLKKWNVAANVSTVIGHSRGGPVSSETARRLLLEGVSGVQVVYLDAEGWGDLDNEVSIESWPINLSWSLRMAFGWACIGPDSWKIANSVELAALGARVGYADAGFHGWAGTRTDQYRQRYSNTDKLWTGAEALDQGNDTIIEEWPPYSTSAGQELCHTEFPEYFSEWVYLTNDSAWGNRVVVETPHRIGPGALPTQAPGPATLAEKNIFNGRCEDGSAAGWTYHGGHTPFESQGVNGIEPVDGGYEFQIAPGNGLSALRHNWQVSPSAASGMRFSVEHWDLLWETDDSLSVYWENNYLGTVYSGDVNSGPVTVTMSCPYPNAVGRLRFSPYFQAYDAEFLLDNVEFVGGSRPGVGTLTGNPNPVVQGANLRLVAGGVFDADGSVAEVRFYGDSNGNGTYDSGTDASFGVAYSGSSGNWEVTQTTAGIPVGQHYFFALTKDSDGLWSAAVRSAARIEVTQPVNQAPTIGSLSDSPDPVDRGSNLTLTATSVVDVDGMVARVDFYHDANNNGVFDEGAGALMGTDNTVVSGQASVTFGTGSLPAETRRFFAVAYDNGSPSAASGAAFCRTTIVQKWDLSYQISPAGSGTITENPVAGRYADGTLINPSASAATNYRFDHWEVNAVAKTMPVTLSADTTVKAVFVYNGATVVLPILNAVGNQSVNAGVAFSLTVMKQQGDTPITWTLEGAPSGMTIDQSGVITWPNPTPMGSSHFVSITAQNSAGSDSEAFTLSVIAPRVSQPKVEPPEGYYPDSLDVVITCDTPNAIIRYTTDGCEPTTNDMPIASGGSLRINETTLLIARAWKSGYMESHTMTALYSIPSPRISILRPTDGDVIVVTTAQVDVVAKAADGLARVDWLRDGAVVGTTNLPVAVNVWSNSFVWSGLAFGTNTLTAIATDLVGGATTSTPVRVVVERTRTLTLTGALAFGNVTVGQQASRTLALRNDGNTGYAVTSIVATAGFSVTPRTFTLGAGGGTNVTVTFAPTVAQAYPGTVTVLADAPLTAGSNTHPCSGTGTRTMPLADALDSEELVWTTGGNTNWYGQVLATHDGVDAAQSGRIGHGQQTWVETTVEGPARVSFWWKVSSESGGDFLRFFVGAVEQPGAISGETGWAQKVVSLPAGNNVLKWSYAKNGAASSGDDCGWVDQIAISRGVLFEQVGVTTGGEGNSGSGAFNAVARVVGVGPASVDVYVLPGSAGTADYVAPSAPITLTWAAGEIATKVVTIPIKGDTLVEGDEIFYLLLGNAVGTDIGEPNMCTVTITDDDAGTLPAKGVFVAGVPQPPEGGKVTGGGFCLPGKTVKLTATANAGWTFIRWEDHSQIASRTVTGELALSGMQDGVMLCTAFFKRTVEIAPPVADNPGAQDAMVGLPFDLSLPVESECLPLVTVAGLPSGLAYSANGVRIIGVPTQAGTFTVTFASSNPAGAAAPQTFVLNVERLPSWAQGAFNGFVWVEDGSGGLATMSVTAAGKISGKFMFAGTSYSFSAPSYSGEDVEYGSILLSAVAKASGKPDLPFTFEVWPCADPGNDLPEALGVAYGWCDTNWGGDALEVWLYRDVWQDPAMAGALTPYIGYYTATLPGDGSFGSGYLAFTVDARGGVKTAGKLADGTMVSMSGALVFDGETVWTVVYTAPRTYQGGALAGIAEFVIPEEGARPVVRLLYGSDYWAFTWVNRSPSATGEYGEGFFRETGLSGGWYDKLINLRDYYENGLAVDGVGLPDLAVSVRYTDWNEAGTRKVSRNETERIEGVEDASPNGLVLAVTPATGTGTGLAAPRADTPAKLPDGTYNYGADSNGDGQSNIAGLTFKFTRATGLFSGSFKAWYDYASAEDFTTGKRTLKHASKTIKFEGALTPYRGDDEADAAEGRGFFLWGDQSMYDTGRTDRNGNPVMRTYKYNDSYDLLLMAE